MNEETRGYIEQAADRAAKRAVSRLRDADRIKRHTSGTFRKTEEVLRLYPKLPEGASKQRVTAALDVIRDQDYFGVVESLYFDGLTIAEVAEIYDVKYQNISKKRNRLVKAVAAELFPEEVMREVMGR